MLEDRPLPGLSEQLAPDSDLVAEDVLGSGVFPCPAFNCFSADTVLKELMPVTCGIVAVLGITRFAGPLTPRLFAPDPERSFRAFKISTVGETEFTCSQSNLPLVSLGISQSVIVDEK